MKNSTFINLLHGTHARMLELSASKGAEYCGDDDQLANFKRLGKELSLIPEKILWVYLTKHLDSLTTYIKDAGDGTTRKYSEPIIGRVDDAILYLNLLKALITERERPLIDSGTMDASKITTHNHRGDQDGETVVALRPHPGAQEAPMVTGVGCTSRKQAERLAKWALVQGEDAPVTIEALQSEIRTWADSVFPNRTAHEALIKLVLHEIPEFLHGGLSDPLEYGDLLILILDIADRNGINAGKAARDKMAINRARKWAVDPVTKIAQHISEVAPS